VRIYPDSINLYLRDSFVGTILADAGLPRPESQNLSANQEILEGKSGGYYLHQNLIKNAENSSIEIVKSGCLWTCNQTCAVSFLASNKYIYILNF